MEARFLLLERAYKSLAHFEERLQAFDKAIGVCGKTIYEGLGNHHERLLILAADGFDQHWAVAR